MKKLKTMLLLLAAVCLLAGTVLAVTLPNERGNNADVAQNVIPKMTIITNLQNQITQLKTSIDTQIEKDGERERLRADFVRRIDGYLANCGSPLAGLGGVFYDQALEYGIEPRLSVAISQAESSAGLANFAPHNAWGMVAYPQGWSSWEEGIHQNIEWLHRYYDSPQTAFDCPGYCEPSHPWMENVQGVLDSI
jgi:hypothetical protein